MNEFALVKKVQESELINKMDQIITKLSIFFEISVNCETEKLIVFIKMHEKLTPPKYLKVNETLMIIEEVNQKNVYLFIHIILNEKIR